MEEPVMNQNIFFYIYIPIENKSRYHQKILLDL